MCPARALLLAVQRWDSGGGGFHLAVHKEGVQDSIR